MFKIRSDYHNNWLLSQLSIPPKGFLSKGEVGIAIVTDDETGTGEGNIVEVVGKIGAFEKKTPFNDCPVIFRTPGSFVMETKEAIFNELIDITKTNAYKDVIDEFEVEEEIDDCEDGEIVEEEDEEEIVNPTNPVEGWAPEFSGEITFETEKEE